MNADWRARLLRRALHDGRTKLTALAVAVIAFHSIRNVLSEERPFRVRIVPTLSQEGGVAILNVEPGEVRVWLRGAREQLDAVREEELTVRVTPRRPPAGGEKQDVALRPNQLVGRYQARVTRFEPAAVQLAFDVEGEVRLSVARPRLKGIPLMGAAEVLWTETGVVARGPLNQLQTLRDNAVQLATEEIDVEGRVQSFSRRVKVMPPKGLGSVQLRPEEIEVRVAIKVETETRIFNNIPVLLTAIAGSGLILTSEPAVVTVRVTGVSEQLNRLQPSHISVIADCRGIDVDDVAKANYPLRVYLPPGIEGLQPEAVPTKVTVYARRVQAPSSLPTPAAEAPTPVP